MLLGWHAADHFCYRLQVLRADSGAVPDNAWAGAHCCKNATASCSFWLMYCHVLLFDLSLPPPAAVGLLPPGYSRGLLAAVVDPLLCGPSPQPLLLLRFSLQPNRCCCSAVHNDNRCT